MAGMLRVPRTRGALGGGLLILLGLWGGLIPFVGPYFHFSYTPATPWTYTTGRFWLEILPAAGTVAGGLILLASRVRPVAMLGGWLAAASGVWFTLGQVLSPLWRAGGTTALGTPAGGTVTRVLVQVSYLTGLGVVIVFLAAVSIGRLAVVGVRDAELYAEREVVTEPAEPETARAGLHRRGAPDGVPADEAAADRIPADEAAADEDAAVSAGRTRPPG